MKRGMWMALGAAMVIAAAVGLSCWVISAQQEGQERPSISPAQIQEGREIALAHPAVQDRLAGTDYLTQEGTFQRGDGQPTSQGVAVTVYTRAEDGTYYQAFVVLVDLETHEVVIHDLAPKPKPE